MQENKHNGSSFEARHRLCGKEVKNMNAVLEKLSRIGIVPVVKIDRAEDAVPLAKALCAGGLPCAEVTFRTDAAAAAIKAMTENFPEMCVGAGTVLNAEIGRAHV